MLLLVLLLLLLKAFTAPSVVISFVINTSAITCVYMWPAHAAKALCADVSSTGQLSVTPDAMLQAKALPGSLSTTV